MAGPQPDYGITAVTRTAAIVAVLVRLGPSPLTRLAAEAGCTAPNAFRILHTLCALGLVVQEGKRGPWRLGVGWLPIAQAANDQGALLYCARPMVEAFAQSCGEPVSFLVRDGEQCHVVAAHPSNPPIRAYTAPAVREPLHAGPGRLLLAYAPLRIQHAVLASRMARLGPSTRTDPAWVGADLPRIRARSWLITTDEVDESAVTVSVPVRDRMEAVIGALNIVAPGLRMRAPRPHTLLTPLTDAAAALGKALG